MNFNIMNFIVSTLLLFVACCCHQASSTCFVLEGSCQDGNRTYTDAEIWTPINDPCHSCTCVVEKEAVDVCVEIVFKENTPSLKKKTSHFTESVGITEEEVVLTEQEAKVFQCPESSFSATESPEFKIVNYVLIVRINSLCCKMGMQASGVHPLCQVKQSSKSCDQEVVLKEDETKPCPHPYNML